MDNEDKKVEIVNEVNVKVPKGNRIKISGSLIILIIAIVLLFGGSLFGIKSIFTSQEKVLKLGFEDVGELVTQTCHTVVLEDSKESLSFFELFDIPFTESRQIFSYDFDVDASIDFSKIEIKDIDDANRKVTITVPHSRIYKIIVLPDTFKSYLDSDGLFTRIDLSEHNDALIRMEDIAKAQCLEGKLLDNADQNAQKLLSAIVKSDKRYKDYNVEFDYYLEEDKAEIRSSNQLKKDIIEQDD